MAEDELRVFLGVDLAEFDEGLNEATAKLKKFGEAAKKLGAMLTINVTAPLAALAAVVFKSRETEKATENLSKAFDKFSSTLQSGFVPYAITALNVLEGLVKQGTSLADAFRRAPGWVQALVVTLGTLAAAAGPVLVALGTFVTSILPAIKIGFAVATGAAALAVAKFLLIAGVGAMLVANWRAVVDLFKVAFYGALGLVVKGVEKFYGVLAMAPGKVGATFGKARDVAAEASKEMGDNFNSAAESFEKNSVGIGSAVDFVKSKFSALSKAVKDTANDTRNVTAAFDGMANVMAADDAARLAAQEAALERFRALKAESVALAQGIKSSIGTAIGDTIAGLAEGTLNLQQIWIGFLRDMLAKAVTWAIAQMTIFQTVSTAAAAMMTANPFLAIAAIAAMIAVASNIKMAKGGIVTGPTNALIGEAGPEAVIPLSGGKAERFLGSGDSGKSQTISVYLDGKAITKAVVQGMPDEIRLQGVFR